MSETDDFEEEGEYEDGDINVVADADYEDGDINAVSDVDDDDDDDDDVDDDDEVDDDPGSGNRSEGGMSHAVLTYIAQSLSNEPAGVVVDSEPRGNGVRLSLHVAPTDMGRVIGRRGRTAQAIRVLIAAAGAREGVQTSVDIVDD